MNCIGNLCCSCYVSHTMLGNSMQRKLTHLNGCEPFNDRVRRVLQSRNEESGIELMHALPDSFLRLCHPLLTAWRMDLMEISSLSCLGLFALSASSPKPSPALACHSLVSTMAVGRPCFEILRDPNRHRELGSLMTCWKLYMKRSGWR